MTPSAGYLRILKFCELTGYTEKAIKANIQKGLWCENRVWRKALDGRVMINVEAFNKWVETETTSEKAGQETDASKQQRALAKLPLHTDEHATQGRGLRLFPLKEAGLKPHHVAKLLGTSRGIADQWLNNRSQPHPFFESKINLLLESTRKAVEDQKLPAPAHYRGHEENSYIFSTLEHYMTLLQRARPIKQ